MIQGSNNRIRCHEDSKQQIMIETQTNLFVTYFEIIYLIGTAWATDEYRTLGNYHN